MDDKPSETRHPREPERRMNRMCSDSGAGMAPHCVTRGPEANPLICLLERPGKDCVEQLEPGRHAQTSPGAERGQDRGQKYEETKHH